MIGAVLDASALLALLLDESGGGRVAAALADSVISAVNLGEVVGHFARNGVDEADIRRVLDPLPVAIYPFDDEIAFMTGMMLPVTRSAGLSFGDRACLATARLLRVPALTADRAWSRVAAELCVSVDVIR